MENTLEEFNKEVATYKNLYVDVIVKRVKRIKRITILLTVITLLISNLVVIMETKSVDLNAYDIVSMLIFNLGLFLFVYKYVNLIVLLFGFGLTETNEMKQVRQKIIDLSEELLKDSPNIEVVEQSDVSYLYINEKENKFYLNLPQQLISEKIEKPLKEIFSYDDGKIYEIENE